MFCSNLRMVPWRDRDEWMKVYVDAYSSDSIRQSKACCTMETWLLMRNDVPPGVECTLNILSAIKEMKQQNSRNLQLILSTAVLRVVNMLCDNARISDRESIYSIAKFYNLPDWIVNLRHDVSHGTSLPDITTLKRAGTFLLSWLKEYYWEVEKEGLKDIALERSREEACRDNVEFIINNYIDLMKQFLELGNVKIKKLPISDILTRLSDINKRRGFECAMECLPWMSLSKDSFAPEIPANEIPSMRISLFINHLLLLFQDYVTKKSFWKFDSLKVLADFMCNHYNRNECIVQNVWEPMIQKVNDLKELDKLITIFYQENRLNNEASLSWFSELIRSAFKRHLYDNLKAQLSICILISSNVQEQTLARNTMFRKRLGLPTDCNEITVQMKLFKKIEKKHSDLKEAISLTSPIQYFLDDCLALNIIKMLALNPNKHTITHLNYLFPLVKPKFSEIKKQELINLVLLRLGQKTLSIINSFDSFKIKTVNDLLMLEKQTETNNNIRLSVERMEIANDESDLEDENFYGRRCNFVRSNWDFSSCPLGTTPWELEGVEYYHKPFNPKNAVSSYIFPISLYKS